MKMNVARACRLVVSMGFFCASLAGCSRPVQAPTNESQVQPATTTQLVGHIWRVEQPASGFLGTIYIFVADGTLLETSCKETYRIAKWSSDANSAQSIQVIEDAQPAFTGTILEQSATGIRLQRRMRHGETDELKLSAVAGEFVCPDLR
jgi:hypothetical protein